MCILSTTVCTLPYLLERASDIDASVRRTVFARILPELGDFRQLSIGMRVDVLRCGMTDRDESVRKAARDMFNNNWVNDVNGDLLELLERLDVASENIEDGGPTYMALRGFWDARKDVILDLKLDQDFWDGLTVEGSFLARSFNDYCRTSSPQDIRKTLEADECMPEPARLAIYLQRHINKLVMALRNDDEEAVGLEFIVQQLLLIAMASDYGDEIGRRGMFALIRECVCIVEMSEPVTKLAVKVLRTLVTSETDFCLIILEIIAAIHDATAEDDFHSAQSNPSHDGAIEGAVAARSDSSRATPAHTHTHIPATPPAPITPSQRSRNRMRGMAERDSASDADMMDVDENDLGGGMSLEELAVNLKILYIAQCMLENVVSGMKNNPHLVTMLNGLIVPAVRSQHEVIREAGLMCLGLSCLLDKVHIILLDSPPPLRELD